MKTSIDKTPSVTSWGFNPDWRFRIIAKYIHESGEKISYISEPDTYSNLLNKFETTKSNFKSVGNLIFCKIVEESNGV